MDAAVCEIISFRTPCNEVMSTDEVNRIRDCVGPLADLTLPGIEPRNPVRSQSHF
jgi:hypothetical protein